MKHIKAREESRGVHHSLEGQRGQGIAEYGIILILVSVALVVVINLMGPAIEDIFEEVANDGPMAPPSLMGYTPPPSPTVSPTSTFGPSPTATATATATGTPTNTPTPLPPTVTNTPTPTRTPIPSPTNTPLPATHTATATRTPTPSPTATSTSTLTPTPTRTPVVLPSNTPVLPTNTPTLTPSPTPTPSGPWTYVHAMQGDASVVRSCVFIFWCTNIGIDVEVHVQIRRSNNHSNVRNAIAYGTWNDGQNDNCANSTGNDGWCTIERRILWVDEATFTVTNVTHSSLQYNGLLNHRSSITVSP